MKRFFLLVVFLLFFISQFAYGASVGANRAKFCTLTGCRIGCINLRSGPGTRYQKVTDLYQGYLLAILAKKGNWYQVKVVDPPEGKTGWVKSNLVTLK